MVAWRDDRKKTLQAVSRVEVLPSSGGKANQAAFREMPPVQRTRLPMTARTLTAQQKLVLLWLAERPGEWRDHACCPSTNIRPFRSLSQRGLVEWNFFCCRLTPAGIQAAKELEA